MSGLSQAAEHQDAGAANTKPDWPMLTQAVKVDGRILSVLHTGPSDLEIPSAERTLGLWILETESLN